MSGGIIIQRRLALLSAVKAPCFYDELPDSIKSKIDAIDQASPSACTQQDLVRLARYLRLAVECDD